MQAADALACIPPDDRDTWVRVGMSLKAELGDAGWSLWDAWSRQSDKYHADDARAVWRSIKPDGGIGPGTMYALAKQHGWQGAIPDVQRYRSPAEPDYSAGRAEARRIVAASLMGHHPYLERKGFPAERVLIYEDTMVIPMRLDGGVESVQRIWPDGRKKFLSGARASGTSFELGRGGLRWLVEGYATGLSVRAALQAIYRRDTVVVCFSASGIVHQRGHYVIADNDESGTGQRYAAQTGLPYWMPADVGSDANDYHARCGIRELANRLRELINPVNPSR